MASNSVSTTLVYFTPPADGAKPVTYVSEAMAKEKGAKTRNYELVKRTVQITNIRGKEHEMTLDGNGFEYRKHQSAFTNFGDDKAIERDYYHESAELLKKLTGASRVQIFDHTIRRHRPGEVDSGPQKRQPVPLVHVDQTNASAERRVHRHMPAEDVPALLTKRYQIINLWRPISHPALDFPLALCDYRTTDPSDLMAGTLHFETYTGETFNVQYNEKHQWKYVRGMGTDEIVLIKCFDTLQDGSVAVLTPHTAFTDPTTPADAPLRESIELRALVFYD